RHHRSRRVEELRLQHDHPAGRLAEHSRAALRGRPYRRRTAVAPVPPRDAADARSDRDDGEHPHHCGILSAVRRALRDDAGRAAAQHRQRALLHVRGRLQVVESGLGLGRRVRPVPVHLLRHGRAAPARAMAIRRVTPSLPALLVNGLLLGMATVTLFPLVWMVSVSLMSPGEASTFPPPLLPARLTFENYRELFAHAGMGRYLLNSVM